LLCEIARLCSDFSWGRLLPATAAALAGARLIQLGKPSGGVRPIAVGELFRRIAGKMLVSRYQSDCSDKLLPLQYGVGSRGGAETIIHFTRNWMAKAPPNHALLQLDFKNAFNSLSRQSLLSAVEEHCPLFYHFAKACYQEPATLFGSGYTIASAEGEHQ
jgi:hypothetical protein